MSASTIGRKLREHKPPLTHLNSSHGSCCGTDKHPRDVTEDVDDHHDIMDIMVVGGGNVDPAPAYQGSYYAKEEDQSWKGRTGGAMEVILEEDKRKTRSLLIDIKLQHNAQQRSEIRYLK